MSLIAALGALETGLIFALVALAVFTSFRVLNFPDLTVDGSFPLGGAVCATLISAGTDAFLATLAGTLSGALAGFATGWLNVRLKILHLLAGILVMTAMFSINLRIMGRPNVPLLDEVTVFTPFQSDSFPAYVAVPVVMAVLVALLVLLLRYFLGTELGQALRAVGSNPRMASAQGISTSAMTLLGLSISNGLAGLAGALFVQSSGGADVSMGIGVVIIGLAAVIGGEALLPSRGLLLSIFGCVLGAIAYRFAIALALNLEWIGLKAQDLNLVTALLIVLALSLPRVRQRLWTRSQKVVAQQVQRYGRATR
ncbi:putative ABC transport system permease protein [Mesorhizobium soli]|uniref:ABC transporter permease n=1 Tax=Pseudaminobacter soli (ex Li et al. 2025) TaxID=1295366 RepID=UPI002473FD50|nr:ABC transporter permease [Mesorhizobium soli]MDH6234791.1 putative ABC transport system permease protein [Mesorhizobium soli]